MAGGVSHTKVVPVEGSRSRAAGGLGRAHVQGSAHVRLRLRGARHDQTSAPEPGRARYIHGHHPNPLRRMFERLQHEATASSPMSPPRLGRQRRPCAGWKRRASVPRRCVSPHPEQELPRLHRGTGAEPRLLRDARKSRSRRSTPRNRCGAKVAARRQKKSRSRRAAPVHHQIRHTNRPGSCRPLPRTR